jgi:L-aminopeptidase/D-esterase-like protein
MNDGDTIFAMGTGAFTGDTNVTIIGGLAAETMSDAILRAVRAAKGLPGLPAFADLVAAQAARSPGASDRQTNSGSRPA